MIRTYELALVFDPHQSDDDVRSHVAPLRSVLERDGARITGEEDWGRRKLAYPIRKFDEGRYLFLYVSADAAPRWSEVERLILQNDRVLRHLVVRTDEDLKRAASKGKQKPPERESVEGGEPAPAGKEE